jgi:glyoxylase-like metal-dependent hydrolase (beta-lactamase superfamily II)
MVGHVTAPAGDLLPALPSWATLVRADNPGPMTLDGTNSWVLRAPGAKRAVIVDPGPLDDSHLAALADHAPVAFVLVTHGHADHVEGSRRLSELLGGLRVLAADPAHCVGVGAFGADEVFDAEGIAIRALSTPGHTSDSVSFVVEVGNEPAVLTGDTILGRGTTVVAWPDGDLGEYLASLRRLTELGPIPALPGHGPPLADCAAAAEFYLAHRLERLEQIRSARAAGARTAQDVVRTVYADVDRRLWPAAEWSVRAQLAYLDHEDGESAPSARELDRP